MPSAGEARGGPSPRGMLTRGAEGPSFWLKPCPIAVSRAGSQRVGAGVWGTAFLLLGGEPGSRLSGRTGLRGRL